jgi:hypothetical protein
MNGVVDAVTPVDTKLVPCSAYNVIHLTKEACCAEIMVISLLSASID